MFFNILLSHLKNLIKTLQLLQLLKKPNLGKWPLSRNKNLSERSKNNVSNIWKQLIIHKFERPASSEHY